MNLMSNFKDVPVVVESYSSYISCVVDKQADDQTMDRETIPLCKHAYAYNRKHIIKHSQALKKASPYTLYI